MAIKFDIRSIQNAVGKGEERKFVKLLPQKPITTDEITEAIEYACTATRGDVMQVLMQLRSIAVRELSERGAFYLPQIGYFTLQADTHTTEKVTTEQMRGNFVGVRNIKFRPERSFLQTVRKETRFTRRQGGMPQQTYDEATLLAKVTDYLHAHDNILTNRVIREVFGLSYYAAQKWLAHFVDTGVLKKVGTRHAPVYCLPQ